MGELSELFAPDRIAVVGATEHEGAIGQAIMDNLVDEFGGEIAPVDPKYNELLDFQCYGDVGETGADLAIIVVPPKVILPAMRSAGEVGIQNMVAITAGFGEADSEGTARKQGLRDITEEYDLNVVGPNSLNVMNTDMSMSATFGPDVAFDGNMSFASQSGAFITAVIDWTNDEDIGFKDIVSLGDKAVLDEADFIEMRSDNPDTEIVIGCLEGIPAGREFINSARDVTKNTPIVLVKSGKTDADTQAASSRTGTIAGPDATYKTGLEQAGVIRTDSVQRLFDTAHMLDDQPLPEDKDVTVATNAGGPGVMTADAIGESEFQMANFTNETLEAFSESLPAEGNIYNPIDIIGDAGSARFRGALDVVLADDNVNMALVLTCPTVVLGYNQLVVDTAEFQEKYDKPIAACFMGSERVDTVSNVMKDTDTLNYFDPSCAVDGFEALSKYADIRQREYNAPTGFNVGRKRTREILETVKGRDETRLGVKTMELLDAYGIETPAGGIVNDPADTPEVAKDIDGNVVTKIVSPDILHKSDIGGIKVGVENEDVYGTYEDLITHTKNYQPDVNILGVQVQEMVNLGDGVETTVGMNRNPQPGPLMMFGLGGIFVEILEDTAFRAAPVPETETGDMTKEIDAASMLRGTHGDGPIDIGDITEIIQRLSQLVTDFPTILELDINPLVVLPDSAKTVDVRLTVDPDEL